MSMSLEQRNKIALKSMRYAIKVKGEKNFVFIDAEDYDTKPTPRLLPIYKDATSTEIIRHIPYPAVRALAVSHYIPTIVSGKETRELMRIREESKLFFARRPYMKRPFKQYTASSMGAFSYGNINRFLRLIRTDSTAVPLQDKRSIETTLQMENVTEEMLRKHIFAMIVSFWEDKRLLFTTTPVTLYRNIRGWHWDVDADFIQMDSFVSTSSRFLHGFRDTHCCQMILHVPIGTPILHLGSLGGEADNDPEDEFLLPPGLRFQIDQLYAVNDATKELISIIECSLIKITPWTVWRKVLQQGTSQTKKKEQERKNKEDDEDNDNEQYQEENENVYTLLSVNIQAYAEANVETLGSKIHKWKPDFLCIQEDVIGARLTKENGGNFKGACSTGEGMLSNSIYTSDNVSVKERFTLNIQKNCPVGRCAFLLQTNQNLRIANVHLCGGRYDDRKFMDLANVKTTQLRHIVEKFHPDIIAGDFNGESYSSSSLRTHPVFKELDKERQRMYLKYHTDGHKYLISNGYVSVFPPRSGITSRFGGMPDYVYYRPERIRVIDSEIVPFLDVTDHNGLFVQFVFLPKK